MDTAISKKMQKALESKFEKAKASGRDVSIFVNSIIAEEQELPEERPGNKKNKEKQAEKEKEKEKSKGNSEKNNPEL